MVDSIDNDGSAMICDDPNTELAASRTAMAFMRTEMSGDRNLMAVIRTALSLIVFGFTIYQVFKEVFIPRLPPQAPGRFGLALIILGVVLLVLGIWSHWTTVRKLRMRRTRLHDLKLVHNLPEVEISTVASVAILLLLIGVAAIARILFSAGPL